MNYFVSVSSKVTGFESTKIDKSTTGSVSVVIQYFGTIQILYKYVGFGRSKPFLEALTWLINTKLERNKRTDYIFYGQLALPPK